MIYTDQDLVVVYPYLLGIALLWIGFLTNTLIQLWRKVWPVYRKVNLFYLILLLAFSFGSRSAAILVNYGLEEVKYCNTEDSFLHITLNLYSKDRFLIQEYEFMQRESIGTYNWEGDKLFLHYEKDVPKLTDSVYYIQNELLVPQDTSNQTLTLCSD